jgi:hypothetical protein
MFIIRARRASARATDKPLDPRGPANIEEVVALATIFGSSRRRPAACSANIKTQVANELKRGSKADVPVDFSTRIRRFIRRYRKLAPGQLRSKVGSGASFARLAHGLLLKIRQFWL